MDAILTRLRFAATTPGFQQGFDWLRGALDGCGLNAAARYRVELVFEEIVANIVRHGAAGRGETCIEVALQAGADDITLTFDDDGVAFDPCGPAASATAEEAQDGGFGLMLVRRAANEMSYRRICDSKNHLIVKVRA